MPVVESTLIVPVDPETAYAVSQTTGEVRLLWDPFIRRQRLLGGATRPAKGVRVATTHRSGLRMTTEYVSYNPPTNVGMKMLTGSWFFQHFAAGWRFQPAADGGTLATWRYSFSCRPRWLAPLAERIGVALLRRDIDRRIAGFARGCADPRVLAALGDDPA